VSLVSTVGPLEASVVFVGFCWFLSSGAPKTNKNHFIGASYVNLEQWVLMRCLMYSRTDVPSLDVFLGLVLHWP
jgi:hypothetical protein